MVVPGNQVNLRQLLDLARVGVSSMLDRTTFGALVAAYFGSMLLLAVYCLGHGLVLSDPLNLSVTLRWSAAHATGITAMLLAARGLRAGHGWWRLLLPLASAIAVSELLSRGMFGVGLHGYVSVSAYMAIAALAFVFVVPWPQTATLELDFGRRRRLVAASRMVAVRGARNYVEVEIEGITARGLARLTIEDMLRRFPNLLVRTHRSYLVNPRRIVEVEIAPRGALRLRMSSGHTVPVTPRHAAALRAVLVPGCEFVP